VSDVSDISFDVDTSKYL